MNYNNAEFYTSYGSFKQIPKSERTEIAFSGRSNVGKSSLINKIFNRKSLARVSAVPGKTATITLNNALATGKKITIGTVKDAVYAANTASGDVYTA